MALCPKCGYSHAKYVLRSAGTKSSTTYYCRSRNYSSRRLHKTVGYCPECGHHWEESSSISFRAVIRATGYIILFLFYLVFFVAIASFIFPTNGTVEDSTPAWFIILSFFVSYVGAYCTPAVLKDAVKRRISTPLTLNDLIKKKVSSNESPVHAQSQVYSKPVQTVQIRPTYTPKDFDFPDVLGLPDEELIPYAAEIFVRTNTVSVSTLQRILKLGYARAARIVDLMEEKGLVGPFQGSKPRALLITQSQLDEYKRQRNL